AVTPHRPAATPESPAGRSPRPDARPPFEGGREGLRPPWLRTGDARRDRRGGRPLEGRRLLQLRLQGGALPHALGGPPRGTARGRRAHVPAGGCTAASERTSRPAIPRGSRARFSLGAALLRVRRLLCARRHQTSAL